MEKSIGDLELSDFDLYPIWEHPVDEYGDLDCDCVKPAVGKYTVSDGDANVWVRFRGTLADGTFLTGVAYAEAPPPRLLLWTFTIGDISLVLHLPPAPDFVLADTGPEKFAKCLGRGMSDVFPIRIASEVCAASTGEPIAMEIRPEGEVDQQLTGGKAG